MKLPDLPKQIKKREADFGIKLRRWLEQQPQQTCVYEIKQSGINSISFSCLEPAQITYLLMIKKDKEGVLIRNPGGKGEPDYSYFRYAPAWVVVRFPKLFCVIDIDAFLNEKASSKRKSLTTERASAIAYRTVKL